MDPLPSLPKILLKTCNNKKTDESTLRKIQSRQTSSLDTQLCSSNQDNYLTMARIQERELLQKVLVVMVTQLERSTEKVLYDQVLFKKSYYFNLGRKFQLEISTWNIAMQEKKDRTSQGRTFFLMCQKVLKFCKVGKKLPR